MKAYSIISDSRLIRQFGKTRLDQIARVLRADGLLPPSGDLSREQIALFLFVVLTTNSPTESLKASKNYKNLVNKTNRKFNGAWKQFLFTVKAQKEALQDIDRFYFNIGGSFISIHQADNTPSEMYFTPDHKRGEVQDVRIVTGSWVFSIMLQLQQPIPRTTGSFIKE